MSYLDGGCEPCAPVPKSLPQSKSRFHLTVSQDIDWIVDQGYFENSHCCLFAVLAVFVKIQRFTRILSPPSHTVFEISISSFAKSLPTHLFKKIVGTNFYFLPQKFLEPFKVKKYFQKFFDFGGLKKILRQKF